MVPIGRRCISSECILAITFLDGGRCTARDRFLVRLCSQSATENQPAAFAEGVAADGPEERT
jgi:hypothetical protein